MTTPAATPAAIPAKTRWGDREGRRRDILAAARAQLDRGGYLALNMRDIAAGAGVSPGTLYQYFSTKEEIFATLYADAISHHNARVEVIAAEATDLEGFLVALATAYLDLYGAYGRYLTIWTTQREQTRLAGSPFPAELRRALAAATRTQAQLIQGGLERFTPRGRPRLISDPRALTLLWASFNGLADHLTSERHALSRVDAEAFIGYTAQTLAAGLLTLAS